MTKKGRYTYLQGEQPEVLAQTEKPSRRTGKRPKVAQERSKQATVVVLEQPEVLSLPSLLTDPAQYALPPQRKGRRTEPGLKRTDIPREQLNVRIRPELKRAAAGLAGLTGKTLGDVVEAALIEYLEKIGGTV